MVALFYIKMKEDSLYFRNFFQSVDKFWEKGSGYVNFCGNSRNFLVDNPLSNDYNMHNTLKRRVKCDNMTEKGAGIRAVS